jgi:hypothetical protein
MSINPSHARVTIKRIFDDAFGLKFNGLTKEVGALVKSNAEGGPDRARTLSFAGVPSQRLVLVNAFMKPTR